METSSYVIKKTLNKSSLFKHSARPLLAKLDIELTERCNNNCIHCYINLPADDAAAQRKELSCLQIRKILKDAASLGCLGVRFTGGEPLLRDDFEELYITSRKLGLKVLLFTNASLITARLAKLFRKIPPREAIEVTIYGMKKGSYEAATRASGSYQAAFRGINLLLENKIEFAVKGVLLAANRSEIKTLEQWAQRLPGMRSLPPSYVRYFDLRARRDCPSKNRLIKQLRVSPEEGLRIIPRDKKKYLKEMKQFCAKFIGQPSDKLFTCGAGAGGGCVDAYGFFQPCMMVRHPNCVYELKNGSLKDALENFFPKLREMRSQNPAYLARCAKCFLRGLCEQCPGKSWMEHGTLDTPVEYLCQIAHAQARDLGLVKKEELAWEVKDWRERIKSFTN